MLGPWRNWIVLPCRAHSWHGGESHVNIYKDDVGRSVVTASGKASVMHSADMGQGLLPCVLWMLRIRHGPCSWKLTVSLGNTVSKLCKEYI